MLMTASIKSLWCNVAVTEDGHPNDAKTRQLDVSVTEDGHPNDAKTRQLEQK